MKRSERRRIYSRRRNRNDLFTLFFSPNVICYEYDKGSIYFIYFKLCTLYVFFELKNMEFLSINNAKMESKKVKKNLFFYQISIRNLILYYIMYFLFIEAELWLNSLFNLFSHSFFFLLSIINTNVFLFKIQIYIYTLKLLLT